MNTPLDFAKLAKSLWHLNQLFEDYKSNPLLMLERVVKDAAQQLLEVGETTNEDEQEIGELEEKVENLEADNKRFLTEKQEFKTNLANLLRVY